MQLEPIDDSIWLTEGAVVSFFGFAYPTRAVIVRLTGGALWIWSPVALTAELRAEIDALGPVGFLVSPNKLHHLYLQDWHAAYPDAALWGPQSTRDKRKDLAFAGTLEDEPPPQWRDDIDQAWVRGSLVLDEVVFFHRASSTAILADLSQNFSPQFLATHWSWWQRPIARLGISDGGAPPDWRASFVHRSLARTAARKILAWAPRRVVIAHGEWQRDNGTAYLERAFAWLRP